MDASTFVQASVLSGTAVALTTEVLKSKYIPIPAQSHPRLVAFILSVIVSGYVVYQNTTSLAAINWQTVLALLFLTVLVSAMTYNHVLKGI